MARILPVQLGWSGAFLAVALTAPATAQLGNPLDSLTIASFRWRSIGPANMAGRVTDVAGLPSPSRTFYVASAAGGIFKTTNAGTTFRPLFQNERCVSMGDIAIAPSDSNVIYAGTGEDDSRNSISPGCGLFKSTDAGLTWKFIGLGETQQIGRILVHPPIPTSSTSPHWVTRGVPIRSGVSTKPGTAVRPGS